MMCVAIVVLPLSKQTTLADAVETHITVPAQCVTHTYLQDWGYDTRKESTP